MLKNKFLFLSFLFFYLLNSTLKAQDDLENLLTEEKKSEKVIATFKTSRIVNSHSVETVKKKNLDFRVTHHFGDVGGNQGGAHTLYGLDNAADIRIAFEYGITDRLTAGFGRSKIAELMDYYLKYRVLHQTVDNKIPVSLTAFVNTGFTPQKNKDAYGPFVNRFSYVAQLLIARKFNSKFSAQLMLLFLHRNYVFNHNDKNDLYSLGIGARLKLTKRFAILADYYYTFSKLRQGNNGYFPPLGIGIEIETGGHVFHIFFTNNAGIVENNYIGDTRSSWSKSQFKLGFNISRTFAFGKRK